MSRPTILPTQYVKSGFHRYTIAELLADENLRCKYEKVGFVGNSGHFATHLNFLPPIGLKNCIVKTHVRYFEASNEAPKEHPAHQFYDAFEKMRERTGRDAQSHLALVTNTFADVGLGKVVEPRVIFDSLRKDEPREFSCFITIALRKSQLCETQFLSDQRQKEDRMCLRKEWYARELIIGYRRVIQILQYLIHGHGDPEEWVEIHTEGCGTDQVLHPSLEGAWRLLCSFESISEVLIATGLSKILPTDPKLSDYLHLVEKQPLAFNSYIDYWRTAKRVRRHIVERKTLEYFMRKSIC